MQRKRSLQGTQFLKAIRNQLRYTTANTKDDSLDPMLFFKQIFFQNICES